MDIAKGAAGISPGAEAFSGGGAGGSPGLNPAGTDRRFADVLAGNAGGHAPAASPSNPVANPFAVPILDDFGGGKLAPASKSLFEPRVDRSQRVSAPSHALNVAGETVGPGNTGLAATGGPQGWQKLANDTFKAETRIDNLIRQAQSGKAFNASELMALQVEVFRYSQTIEVISRTTDKLVGAIKQTLGTQV